jgi:hypothetical protein
MNQEAETPLLLTAFSVLSQHEACTFASSRVQYPTGRQLQLSLSNSNEAFSGENLLYASLLAWIHV